MDVRCQKLVSEFGIHQLISDLSKTKKKLNISQAMALAIFESYRGAQRVSPNPQVGCVILDREGHFLAKGHHEFYGGPHAGKTGSCALAIRDLPVAKVVYGLSVSKPSGCGPRCTDN